MWALILSLSNFLSAAPASGAEPPAKPANAAAKSADPGARPRRQVRGLVVEHDDASLIGTSRHILRATVPAGLTPEGLRRCLDLALDEERIMHPAIDAAAIYLYEEQTHARFTGVTTPLDAAVAHLVWAPGGEWKNPARSISHLDNRTVYFLPRQKPKNE